MKLTPELIQNAMQGNDFWLKPGSDSAKIVDEATKRGYVRRYSHTQVEWTDAGLAKAREELEQGRTRKHVIEVEIPEAWFESGYGELTPQRVEELLCRDRPYTGEDGPTVKLAEAKAPAKITPKEKLAEVLRIMGEEYPEDAMPMIRPLLEEIEKAL